MKALRISTALSLLLLNAVAPAALAVGDSNIDSGVGSGASRGPFGFSNNNDQYYDTPPNSYGVFRDANGALRDPGTIQDNLTHRVPEQTWSQAHPFRGPIPSGAPGGFGGGYGGFGGFGGLALGGGLGGLGGGLGGFGGFGGLAGLTAAGLGLTGTQGIGVSPFPFAAGGILPVGVNGGIPIGVSGAGPAGQAPRTTFGFAGTPGAFFTDFPNLRQRYMGVGSGFIPFNQQTISNTTNPTQNTTTLFNNSSSGPSYVTSTTTPVPGGGSDTVTQFYENGNSYFINSQTRPNPGSTGTTNGTGTGPGTTSSIGATPGTGITTTTTNGVPSNGIPVNGVNGSNTADNFFPDVQPNMTTTRFMTSNNGFSNPAIPNGANTVFDNGAIAHQQSGIGGGFATPQTSGDQRSAFFTDTQATGNSGGFATPQTSGSPRSLLFQNSPNSGSFGGGFATPSTSGSERATIFPNSNNTFGLGGGLGGISAATGNRADRQGASGGSSGSGGGGSIDSGSSGDISSSPRGGKIEYESSDNSDMNKYGFYGPIPTSAPRGPVFGTLGARRALGPEPLISNAESEFEYYEPGNNVPGGSSSGSRRTYNSQQIRARSSEVRQGGTSGTSRTRKTSRISQAGSVNQSAIPYSPLQAYAAWKMQSIRQMNQSTFSGGNGLQGNLTSDLEPILAGMHLTPAQAIGSVIGSTRFENGDIITYGTTGTLKLSHDNSGSITFNDGFILTFCQVTPQLRALALRSLQFL